MLAVAHLDSGDEDAAVRILDALTPEDLRRSQEESGWQSSVLPLSARLSATRAS
jgi:hypothetical protein